MGNPFEQFDIFTIFKMPSILGLNIDFTNSALFMLLAVFSAVLFLWIGARKQEIIPGKMQSVVELCYEFVLDVFYGDTKIKEGFYFNFTFTVFLFVLFCNVLGLVPFGFTVTSHVFTNLVLGIFVFFVSIIAGVSKHKLSFWRKFCPSGIPLLIAPIIIVIELFAFVIRPISLALRLSMNMSIGHVILKALASLMSAITPLLIFMPVITLMGLIGFELFIALLQAYVFMVLTSVYIGDALEELH